MQAEAESANTKTSMDLAIDMYFMGKRGSEIHAETGIQKAQFYRELEKRGLATTRRAQTKLDAKFLQARLEQAHIRIGVLEERLRGAGLNTD